MILDKVNIKNKILVKDKELLETIENLKPGLLATLGAGNIDRFIDQIAVKVKNW